MHACIHTCLPAILIVLELQTCFSFVRGLWSGTHRCFGIWQNRFSKGMVPSKGLRFVHHRFSLRDVWDAKNAGPRRSQCFWIWLEMAVPNLSADRLLTRSQLHKSFTGDASACRPHQVSASELVVYVLCFMYWIPCVESGNLYLISSLNQTWFCGRIYLITRTSRGFFFRIYTSEVFCTGKTPWGHWIHCQVHFPCRGWCWSFICRTFPRGDWFFNQSSSICHEKDYPKSKSFGRSNLERLLGTKNR